MTLVTQMTVDCPPLQDGGNVRGRVNSITASHTIETSLRAVLIETANLRRKAAGGPLAQPWSAGNAAATHRIAPARLRSELLAREFCRPVIACGEAFECEAVGELVEHGALDGHQHGLSGEARCELRTLADSPR